MIVSLECSPTPAGKAHDPLGIAVLDGKCLSDLVRHAFAGREVFSVEFSVLVRYE